jgi:hypothetical protein
MFARGWRTLDVTRNALVSAFSIFVLLLFCAPVFALFIAVTAGIAPDNPALRTAVQLIRADSATTLQSLLVPLLGAIVVFRNEMITGTTGLVILVIMGLGIFVGILDYVIFNPSFSGGGTFATPYSAEYKDVHTPILAFVNLLVVLFLAKLGIDSTQKTPVGGGLPGDPPGPLVADRGKPDPVAAGGGKD